MTSSRGCEGPGTWSRCGRLGTGVLALTLLVTGATPLAAQQGPPSGRGSTDRPQMDRTQIERRIMSQFRSLVRRELGIDSATTDALFGVVEAMQEERRALRIREIGLERRLSGTGVYLSEEQSIAALDEFLALKREELRLLEAEHARLEAVLAPGQLLRFYVLRDQMGERIRRLRGGERGPRGAPSGQPFD